MGNWLFGLVNGMIYQPKAFMMWIRPHFKSQVESALLLSTVFNRQCHIALRYHTGQPLKPRQGQTVGQRRQGIGSMEHKGETGTKKEDPIEWISSGCNDWRRAPVTVYIWLVLKSELTGQQHTALTLSVHYAITHLKQGLRWLQGEYEITLNENMRKSFIRQTKVKTVCHHRVPRCTDHHGQICCYMMSNNESDLMVLL